MPKLNLGATALVKELTKLSTVAVLTATTTVYVGTYNLQSSVDLIGEIVELIETATAFGGVETTEDDPFTNVRELLEYIQRFESSGAVNSQGVQSAYEVVYGGIDAADRPAALTSMTVAEVLAWQDSIDARYPSEAAGAYQVMEDTLRGLVDSGQVSPDAVFNEATQDFVANLLMERRGLSKFVAGKLSAEKFADNLAREWASFPVVRNQQGAKRYVERGQSYYAGDGLNKAHADADEFLGVVEGILLPPGELLEATTTTTWNAQEQTREHREASANASKTGTVTLGATKPVDGPVKFNGQIDLINYRDWKVTTNAAYVFESNSYQVGGTATYAKDNLSFSFSGEHDTDDSTEFSAEMKLRF